MIPSILSQQVRRGVEDFLRTTFPVTTPFFQGAVERLISGPNNIFKGPYLSVKLPFRKEESGHNYFPDINFPYTPHQHQVRAFERLSAPDTSSTLIATGTGSGKTECFFYPILNYCYQNRGERGIKSVIVYPMNALATDQAKRFAQTIHANDKLRNNIRVGLYIGQGKKQHESANSSMKADQVITDRDTLQLSPPDILMTNYKMLDFLLLRPEDSAVWKDNVPETMKYLVVDELHTFDGAQGTDLACLIRRLKEKLQTPAEYLCSVGTSATLGGGENPEVLREYAEKVFGEKFDDDSVITESVLHPSEFFGNHYITRAGVPPESEEPRLLPDNYDDVDEYIQEQARLWFGYDQEDITSPYWRVKLSENLMGHAVFRNLILLLQRGIYTMDDIIHELDGMLAEFSGENHNYKRSLVESLLALVSVARATKEKGKYAKETDGGKENDITEEDLAPFLDVRCQLWLRELRRIVCEVDHEPTIRFSDDLTPEQAKTHLPLVHCRECGAMGWAGTKTRHERAINPDVQHFYKSFFGASPTVHFLFPDDPPAGEEDFFGEMLCGHCLTLNGQQTSECDKCGNSDRLLQVYNSNPRRQKTNRTIGSHNCPYCGAYESLTIVGSRAASLTSVSISQLFSSRFNNDKKLLTFSDSVQDAAHRAGFFGARTYRFNLRAALQQYVDQRLGKGDENADELLLSQVTDELTEYYKDKWSTNDFIGTFLPPDLDWLHDAETLKQTGRLPQDTDLPELLAKRLEWEVLSEYAFRSRIGRTLEKTGSSVAAVRTDMVKTAIDDVVEKIRNEIGGLRNIDPDDAVRFTVGFLNLLKTKGAVFQQTLDGYIKDLGSYYLLNRIHYMPNFGQYTRTPVFLTTKSGTRFDQLLSSGQKAQTWYENWASRWFAEQCPQISAYADKFYNSIITSLENTGVLESRQVKNHNVWGLQPEALYIANTVEQYVCQNCGYSISAPTEQESLWNGMPCLRNKCSGHYKKQTENYQDYYGRLYRSGDIQRINAYEHTALLEKEKREEIEKCFEDRQNTWDPNLLSCTPTLEMGIDIGDLSSAILCNVPPDQSHYLQRIGRTGRKDGNSFNLTVANGNPHDLYFYEQPTEMIAGNIEPPGCFLSAEAVLERQFIAFCFDRWIAHESSQVDVPRTLRKVLNNLDAEQQQNLFPYNLLEYIKKNRTGLLDRFTGMFPELPEEVDANIRAFVNEGEEGGGGLSLRILERLYETANEIKRLRQRASSLREAIKRHKDNPAKDQNYQEVLDDMENEKNSLAEIASSLSRKGTYNFFSDEGLLPNYAFPEAGISLRSIILRKKKKIDNQGKYEVLPYEYERPARSAIREFAPTNHFYANGRHVVIDRVDMQQDEGPEEWRFCNLCPYMENTALVEEKSQTCPRCGSSFWSDEGQKLTMLRFRQAFATSVDRKSRIRDDSDEREPKFFTQHMLVTVDPDEIRQAYKIDSDEIPFGFEFVRKVKFREINFGNSTGEEDVVKVAGKEVPKSGFLICEKCGMVQKKSFTTENDKQPKHTFSCPARNRHNPQDYLRCVYLYREFNSEAVRILLPMTSFAGSELKLQSFTASILLGLRLKFRGNIDHLFTTVQEEPMPDNPNISKRYLVIYDIVPGGTGYLQELLKSQQSMLDIFELALEQLRTCSCANDTDKDGCYHCLYAYSRSFEIPNISRENAIEILNNIVSHKEAITETDTISNISQNVMLESDLEAYFIEALREARDKGYDVELKKEIVNRRPGWFLRINEQGYYIEPQVNIGQRDYVPISCRADFVFYPEREESSRPIAVFTDGFMYHADSDSGNRKSKAGYDMAQRMALVKSGSFLTWSITWQDVDYQINQGNDWYLNCLLPWNKRINRIRETYDTNGKLQKLGNLDNVSSFDMLLKYLAEPAFHAWQTYAFLEGLKFLQTPDKINIDDLGGQLENIADNDWMKDLLDVNASSISNKLIGWNSFLKDSEGKGAVSILAWTPQTSLRECSFDQMQLICRLEDYEETADEKEFRKAWNGFLRVFNVMQFLPNSLFVTSQGILDDEYSLFASYEPWTHARTMSKVSVAEEELNELIEVTDPELHSVLVSIGEKGLPIPEVPCELTGNHGEIAAEAEIGWSEIKVAFVYENDTENFDAFKKSEWTVATVEELIDSPGEWLDDCAAKLRNN